ncbi:MAG: hypothetical protein IT302_08005 [Dehalococcoidia bacterium]|nr:hypothetical protein [Dehalococcoidia bacterium]
MSRAPCPALALSIPLALAALGLAVAAGVAIARDLSVPAAGLTAGAAIIATAAAKAMDRGYPAVFVPIATAWGEAALFAGAAWHFGNTNDHAAAMAAFAALAAAIAQSYTAARASVVGAPIAEGPVRYPVRSAVLAAALAFGHLEAAVWALAVAAMGSALFTFARLLVALKARPA